MSAKQRKWTPEESDRLHELVEDAGEGTGELDDAAWEKVATHFGRTVKACRERYAAPAPAPSSAGKPLAWSLPEERLLFQLQSSSLGNSWTAISSCLPGRHESSVKNRYYSALRRVERAFRCSPEAAAGMLSSYARNSATAEEAAAVAAAAAGGAQNARPGRAPRSAERSGQAEASSGGEGGEEGVPSTAVLLARARAAEATPTVPAKGRRVQFEDAVLEGRPGEGGDAGAAAPSAEGDDAVPMTAPRRAAPRRGSGQQRREERDAAGGEAPPSPPHPARLTALLASLDAGGAGHKRGAMAMSVAESAAQRGRTVPARVADGGEGEEEEMEAPRPRAKRGRRGGGGGGVYRSAPLPSVPSSASSSSMGLGTLRLGLPEGAPEAQGAGAGEQFVATAARPPFPPAPDWGAEGGLPSRAAWGAEGGHSLISFHGGGGAWGSGSIAGSSFMPGWAALPLPAPSPSHTASTAYALPALGGRPRLAGYTHSDAIRPPPLSSVFSPGMRPGPESAGLRVAAVPQRGAGLAHTEENAEKTAHPAGAWWV